MAKYTIELREIVESGINIFDFPYNFYDEEERANFQRDFIRHFYFREIGCETIDRFKLYLEDKFATVFPYYNKLLEASIVEYNLLDHYRLEETFERQTDNENNSSGVSSMVGQVFDKNETTAKGKMTEEGETENNRNGNTTITGETSTTGRDKTDYYEENQEKFLDTPQGKLSLSDSKYLTHLKENDKSGNTDTEKTENVESSQTTEENTTDAGTMSKQTDTDNNTSFEGETKTTSDANTRSSAKGTQNEKYTMIRSGNIGVATDAEGIQKHVDLRKTLDNLKRMFFDECEDLFMMIY